MEADDAGDGVEVVLAELVKTPLQASLANGGDLVGHGFPPFPVERDIRLGGVEALDLA